MVLNEQFSRVLRGVRRWRGSSDDQAIPVHPDLPDADWRHLSAEIDASVATKGGPVAARRRARTIGLTYESLSQDGRLRFLDKLAAHYGHNDAEVDRAMDAVFRANGPEDRRAAETELRAKLQPRRELLLRRLASQEGGLPFLISLRADLLRYRKLEDHKDSAELSALDGELRQILTEWFDVGMLRLEQLTWDTPAAFLEKLIEYEAVHAIESWDDLKHRLGPGRRCYAFVHPVMPDDPLIFVEVALTKDIARGLEPLLAADSNPSEDPAFDEADFDTAIFYSISNCQRGLAGVSLGDFLIKSVAEKLGSELPGIKSFATLSPIPGFRGWLRDGLDAGSLDDGTLSQLRTDDGQAPTTDQLSALVDGAVRPDGDPELERHKPVLLHLMARYLLSERRGARAIDPVAHFHLSNGARVELINWQANPNPVSWDRGLGMMVNYRYELKHIEQNHDSYVSDGVVAASDKVKQLLELPKISG